MWRFVRSMLASAMGATRVTGSLPLIWGGVSACLIAITILLAGQQGLGRADLIFQDLFAQALQRPVSDEIVLVSIDDRSLAAIGRWPWRRSYHAELLRKISKQTPKVIGLDLILTEPDSQYPLDDAKLQDAVRDSGNVVLPVLSQNDVGASTDVVLPVAPLATAAARMGHIQLVLDTDGVVRSTYAWRDSAGRRWPHFVFAMFGAAGRGVRLESAPTMLIPYVASPGHFKRVSYIDVLEDRVPRDVFRDKWVLIGATAGGLGYSYPVPGVDHAELMSGVEIAANLLQAELAGQKETLASARQNILFNVMVVALALGAVAFLPPVLLLLAMVALVAATLTGGYVLTATTGLIVAPAASIAIVVLLYPLWSWLRLTVAMNYLLDESRRLKSEWDLPGQPESNRGADLLEQRIGALSRATEQLRNLHRFVSESIAKFPDPTLVADTRGVVLMANDAAAQYFGGGSAASLRGQKLHHLMRGVCKQESNEPVLSEDFFAAEPRSMMKSARDAKGHDVLVKCVTYSNAVGKRTGWILNVVDVTLVREMERQRDDALRFISHDMRSPQSSILALIQLRRLGGQMKADAQLLGEIERFAEKALHLADNFIHLVRARSTSYQFELLDLNGVVMEALDEVWPQADQRGIKIEHQSSMGRFPCVAHRSLLERAIVNLLINAIKFTPPDKRVTVSVDAIEDAWQVEVCDQGPGISQDKQGALFHGFSRLHEASHPHVGGTGLGLEFVRIVVERHGGSVHVESELGNGAAFRIHLPRSIDE